MAINRYPSAFLEDMHASLECLSTEYPQERIYALIEGALNETCYPLLKRTECLPFRALYANTASADEETLALSPLLVEYQEDARQEWDMLIKKTDGKPALSVIATTESLMELTHRLIPWCVVDAAGYALALSFADTRVLPELFKVLTPAQREALCGPLMRWQYVTRDAQWASLPVAGSDVPAADKVILDEQQCAQLTDASEADNVLFQLRSVSTSAVDCHSPARAYVLVRHWLACADHAQIHSAPDRRYLCEWGLSLPGLESQSRMTEWLQSSGRAQSLDELLDQFQAWITV